MDPILELLKDALPLIVLAAFGILGQIANQQGKKKRRTGSPRKTGGSPPRETRERPAEASPEEVLGRKIRELLGEGLSTRTAPPPSPPSSPPPAPSVLGKEAATQTEPPASPVRKSMESPSIPPVPLETERRRPRSVGKELRKTVSGFGSETFVSLKEGVEAQKRTFVPEESGFGGKPGGRTEVVPRGSVSLPGGLLPRDAFRAALILGTPRAMSGFDRDPLAPPGLEAP